MSTITRKEAVTDDIADGDANTEQGVDESVGGEPGDDTRDDTEPDTDDAGSGRSRKRWLPSPRAGLRAVVVVVAVVAALTVAGILGWQAWQQHQVSQAAHDAQQSAVTYAELLTSIDTDKIDQNFNDVLNGATGEFKDMYSQASVQLRQLLLDNKASAHGVVVESAVQSATKDKVVVLLFIDQSITNSTVSDPRIDRSRVKMTMQRVDGQWRASKVELS